MKCLIDVDILYYEIAALGQFVDEETGEVVMKPFDIVSKAFDERVYEIESECWATEDSLFFMTDNKQLYKKREAKKAKDLKRVEKKLKKITEETNASYDVVEDDLLDMIKVIRDLKIRATESTNEIIKKIEEAEKQKKIDEIW